MSPYALVVGESLVDVVLEPDGSRTERPGGSAANVAVALARLGRPVRLATSFADDERGRAVAAHLERDGVVLATDPYAVTRTSSAQATIAADGSASYVFDLDWRLNPVGEEHPRFVHVCSIGAVLEPGADDVLDLLGRLRGPTVTYDINARPAITGTGPKVVDRVERVVAASHLVKASDEDLEALYPRRSLRDAAAHLLALGPRAVAVTRGGDGATWVDADGVHEVAAPRVEVADTIAAGDTFSAAILDALWDDADRDPAEVLAHAVRAAAVTVSRPGADPPYRHELG
ncbi:carbohydrate kinase [Nocardioides sp. cx-173]|uniref:carbohydrate kinase family protein n=1 Tax=Nocardioides sp. cx-173 TaxID=2898796 RepID=UPI001E288DB4|nr:carbohydrate kinase [Nocardioides sp. cx-173]MCD4525686.1 carbohydrate kinase [Nocardioides sp. cx-173]UGB42824.1 carbohydrate kinase [Nocardioides sp. cx-173]